MKDDIAAGLKNAIERGYSLEQAVQSFINAGYNPIQVKQAAEKFQGVTSIIKPKTQIQKTQQLQKIQQPAKQQSNQNLQIQDLQNKQPPQQPTIMSQSQQPKKHTGLIITLIAILILLFAGLFYLIFFGKEFFSSIFS